jgi:FMN reductase [NAD(P)H]
MTHPLLDILTAHKSDRSYTDQPIPQDVIDAIVEVAHRAPTSHNTQEVSLIVIQSPAIRAQIAEISGGQPWIAAAPVFFLLVMDYHKVALALKKHGKQVDIQNYAEGTIAGCTDVGIALGNMMAAAHALGLGVVPIGGLRADCARLIKLLNLPAYTFPVVGMVAGYVKPGKDAPLKPRMPLSTFCHSETYHAETMAADIDAYDATITAHWQKTGRTNGQTWSESMAEAMDHNYRPGLTEVLEAQGFLKKK